MSFNEVSSKANSSFTRLTYCDSQNSYELDSEIVEDMLKYLNFWYCEFVIGLDALYPHPIILIFIISNSSYFYQIIQQHPDF